VGDLENIAYFLLDCLKLKGFSTNSACLFGCCKKNASEILLTNDERRMAMDSLIELCKKYPGRIYAQGGPLAEARAWLSMEKSRLHRDQPSPKGGRLTGCGVAYSKISVRSDGIITPCSLLPHIELGKINSDPLIDVWRNNPTLSRLRERKSIPLTNFEFCIGCDYIPYCTGSCPGLAHSMTGLTDHPCPDTCLRKYLAEGGTLPPIEV
jgi:SynChlorMet cassette radical SAM/SPASM protein ScmE